MTSFWRAVEIVSAHISNNAVPSEQLPGLIASVFSTLSDLVADPGPTPTELVPAVPIRRSITDDYIICLEDGRKLKTLKRHLMTAYGMTADQYRVKWGMKPGYPMVAASYARKRQELAKAIGLGRKPRTAPAAELRRSSRRAKAA